MLNLRLLHHLYKFLCQLPPFFVMFILFNLVETAYL